MVRKIIMIAFVAVIGVFSITKSALADAPIYTGTFSSEALKGYDSVSYFQGDGVPVKGSKDFQTEWRGAKWLFSSQDNLNAFIANPEKYAPQYGGYCAWAVSQDSLAKGDPQIYTLIDGKLYLNYNKSINDSWLPQTDELIPIADKNYPTLVDVK